MSENMDQVIINQIMEILSREEVVNPNYVEIDCQDGNVTLAGTVFSEEEFREVEWTCWVEGVTAVDNRLVIYAGNQVEDA